MLRALITSTNASEQSSGCSQYCLARVIPSLISLTPRYSKKGIFIAPAFPIEQVVDPTGAGDSYAGAFMGYLAKRGRVSERALREALLYASVIASFGVEGFSLECFERLKFSQIERRMKQMLKMISV